MKKETLYDACIKFVRKAIQIIRKFADENGISPIEFVSVPSDLTRPDYELYDKFSMYQYNVDKLYAENEKIIKTTQEFQNCKTLMLKDKVIKEHFGKKVIVGIYEFKKNLCVDDFARLMTKMVIWKNQSLKFNKKIFDNVYCEINHFYRSNRVRNSMLIALEGFDCEMDEISLEHNIHIVKYPQWRLLNIWFNESRTMKEQLPFIIKISHFAVRFSWIDDKLIDNKKILISSVNSNVPKGGELEGIAHHLISALMVFKKGSIGNGAVIPGIFFWDLLTQDSIMLPTVHFLNSYAFSKTDIPKFEIFWKGYKKIYLTKPFKIAIKRFNYSFERWYEPEDRIVDYLIAFESLFLSDAGKGAYRGEKRFRLALRVSFFLSSKNSTKRKKIFKEMRKAYDIRSAIVHGGDVRSELKDLNMHLPEFCNLIETHLRTCFKKLIEIGKIPDWNNVILDCK